MAKAEPLQLPKVRSEEAGESFVEQLPLRETHRLRNRATQLHSGSNEGNAAPRLGVFPVYAAKDSTPGSSAFSYSEAKTNILSGLYRCVSAGSGSDCVCTGGPRQSSGRTLRGFYHVPHHRFFWWPPGHDLRGYRFYRCRDGRAGSPAWNRIPFRRSRADGHSPDRLRTVSPGEVHPHGSPSGDAWFCKWPCYPGLPRTIGHFKVRDAAGIEHWMGSSQLLVMGALLIATMLIIYLFPKLTRAIPASLAAILIIAMFAILSGIHTKTVRDMASIHGGLPQFHLPAVPWNASTLWIVLPYSLVLAGVGLIETLLTLNLVDDITEAEAGPTVSAWPRERATSCLVFSERWAVAR